MFQGLLVVFLFVLNDPVKQSDDQGDDRIGFLAVVLNLQYSPIRKYVCVSDEVAAELVSAAVKQAKTRKIEPTQVWLSRITSLLGETGLQRLIGVYIQREGLRSVLNPYIAELAEVPHERFKILNHDSTEAGNNAFHEAVRRQPDKSLEAASARAVIVSSEVANSIAKNLLPDELKALQRLHGETNILPLKMRRIGFRSVFLDDVKSEGAERIGAGIDR